MHFHVLILNILHQAQYVQVDVSRRIIVLPLVEAIQTEIMLLYGDTFSLILKIFLFWGISDSADDPHV